MPVEMSFAAYNKDQTLLTKHHQKRIARNTDIDFKGTWRANHSMRTEDVINKLAKINIPANIKSINRYSREYDLMPRPETKSLGRGNGSIAIFLDDDFAEYAASYCLREEFIGIKSTVELVAKARKMVKCVEGTIKKLDDSLNNSHTVDGKEYNYSINKELADLIHSGRYGDLTFNEDGTTSATPRILNAESLPVMMARTWIIYKIKALAGFNPLSKTVSDSITIGVDYGIIHISERNI